MQYLIDGHNLIPHVPGLSLGDLDDEERLIALLQQFSRARRANVHVFFDGAPPGQAGQRRYGALKAHFVAAGRTADDAIRAYLQRLGARAREVTVVTSDRQVRSEARNAHAASLDSAAFARQLRDALNQPPANRPSAAEPNLSEDEIEDWLNLFGSR